MRKLLLIKRRREVIFEISPSPRTKEKDKNGKREITSIILLSRRLDEFEEEQRAKMNREMRIFSCENHSQAFLRSLIPSLNPERKC